MRRVFPLLVGFVFSISGFAQEAANQAPEDGDPWLVWKWVNFAILAGALGYLIWKTAGAFYRSRTEAIQNGIAEATKLKREAEARAAEIERKIAGVTEEMQRMKASAKAEFASEGRRIENETAELARRIQHHAEQEISAATKHALEEMKAYAAKLALDLAEQQVRSGMTTEIDRRLVGSFTHDLGAYHDGGAA